MVTWSTLWLGLVWLFHLRWSQPRYSWREVWQKAHLRLPCELYCLSCLSKNFYFVVGEACLCGHLCIASLHYAFVLPILEYCSPVWGLLLNVIFSFLRARCIRWPGFCPDQTFLSLCHRRHVAALCMLYKVNSDLITVCSASFHLLLAEYDISELRLLLID